MGWKIGGGICGILAVLFVIVAATIKPEYSAGGMEWILAALFAILAALFFWKGAKTKAQKQEHRNTLPSLMSDCELEAIQSGKLPTVSHVPVLLGDGETAHYYGSAMRLITKKKAVGKTGGGGGVSVRVAKGLTLHSGRSASRTVYDNVTDRFPGRIVVTNHRIVFIAAQEGFDCKLSKISAIIPEGNGVLIQSGTSTYRLLVDHQESFERVLEMACQK